MLALCISYETIIYTYIRNVRPDLAVTDDDWRVTSKVMDFLKVFYESTILLSGVYCNIPIFRG